MRRLVFLTVATLCVGLSLGVCLAEEEEEAVYEARMERVVDQVVEIVMDRLSSRLEELEERSGPQQGFEKTVKLQFELTSGEGPGQALSILCAAREYHAMVEMQGQEQRVAFRVGGSMSPADEGGDVFLVYEVEAQFEGRDKGSGNLNAEGSCLLTLGEKTTLIEVEDKSLAVTASQAE